MIDRSSLDNVCVTDGDQESWLSKISSSLERLSFDEHDKEKFEEKVKVAKEKNWFLDMVSSIGKTTTTNKDLFADKINIINSRFKAEKEVVNAFCSWCGERNVQHNLISREWLGRSAYECQHCNKETTPCYGCRSGMTRSYERESADKLCYICVGRDMSKLNLEGKRFCSWCKEENIHTLHQNALSVVAFSRDIYFCQGCKHFCLPCRSCEQMARSHADWNDDLCCICDKTFENWKAAKLFWVGKEAWCSWCLTLSKHEMIQKNMIRRHVYKCDNCCHETLECIRCGENMTKEGEFTCVCCFRGVSWDTLKIEKLRAKTDEKWDFEDVMKEMKRDSKQKKECFEAGHIRSFLILLSMRPSLRHKAAEHLGVSLLGIKGYGDPHVEAHQIVMDGVNGLVGNYKE